MQSSLINDLMLAPIAIYKKWHWIKFKTPDLEKIKTRFISLSVKEKYEFYRLMYINILSWVTLEESLIIIRDATWFQKVELLVKTILKDIWTWVEFWKSLQLFSRAFSEKEIWLMKVWEETWKLPVIFEKLIEDIERWNKIRWEVKAAMMMPWITLLATFWAVYVLLTFVLPKFVQSFKESWNELPWLTKAVIVISDFLIAYPWFVVVLILCFWWAWRLMSFWKWERFKHSFLLHAWPLTSKFIIPLELANFVTTMELMTSSWVDIVEAVNKSKMSIANVHLKEELEEILQYLVKWDWLAWALTKMKFRDKKSWKMKSKSKLLNLSVLSVLQIWDQNWYLTNVLVVQKRLTNEEILNNLKQVSKMIEPLIVIMIAAFVLPIILAIMLPYFWQISNMIEWINV